MDNGAGAEILDSVSSARLWGEQAEPPVNSQSLECFLGLELYPNPPQLSPLLLADPSFLSSPGRHKAGGAGSWGRRVSAGQSEGQG